MQVEGLSNSNSSEEEVQRAIRDVLVPRTAKGYYGGVDAIPWLNIHITFMEL